MIHNTNNTGDNQSSELVGDIQKPRMEVDSYSLPPWTRTYMVR